MTEPKKSGRKTKREETADFLSDLGIDLDELEREQQEPPTFAELDAIATRVIADKLSAGGAGLTTALVNTARVLRELALEEKLGGTAEERAPLIGDVIAGIATLPDARRNEILDIEIARLEGELAAARAVKKEH